MSTNPTHDWEQFGAMARDFAGTTVSYFKALIHSGLTRQEALTLTLGWQTTMLEGMIRGKPTVGPNA